MAAQHTPGPWSIGAGSGNSIAITAKHWEAPLVAKVVADGTSTEICEANAALIASAPDLLAASKVVFVMLCGKCGEPFRDLCPATWREFDEAIRKAEGRQ